MMIIVIRRTIRETLLAGDHLRTRPHDGHVYAFMLT
jgi:hypothetical protein